MDRLAALDIFVRVVETGSFSAVAKERGTSQSAISKAVAGLEAGLGVRLLTRTTRSLALTHHGQTYFETMRRIMNDIAEADATLKAGETQLSGRLTIASSVGYGRLILTPLIDRFLSAHPGLTIDLKLNDGFIDIIEEGVDVAIRLGTLSDSNLISRSLGTSQRALLASRAYRARQSEAPWPITQPSDVTHHNCIVYTGQNHPYDWDFKARDGSMITVHVSGNVQTNSSEVIRAGCLAGMGLCYSPLWLFEKEIASGEVEILLPNWPKLEIGIHAVMAPHRSKSTKVRSLVDFLAAALRASP